MQIKAPQKIILKGELRTEEKDRVEDLLAFDLDVNNTAERVDWTVFLSKAEKIYLESCSDLLKRHSACKLVSMAEDLIGENEAASFVDGFNHMGIAHLSNKCLS